MPRRLLLDGAIVADEWHYLEDESAPGPGSAKLIVPFARYVRESDAFAGHESIGIKLAPQTPIEELAPFLAAVSLVACEFVGPSEGRGYTQARLLRERYEFAKELRAIGYVRRDQLFFMARCGFNSFELPESELDTAAAAFHTFSESYQRSNDVGLARKFAGRGLRSV